MRFIGVGCRKPDNGFKPSAHNLELMSGSEVLAQKVLYFYIYRRGAIPT